MNTSATMALLEFAYPLLIAFSLAVARALGMILVSPVFNRLGLTGAIRSAVAAVIALPVVPAVLAGFHEISTPTGFLLAGLMLKEMVIGLVMGLLFGVPFWAAEVAGELIDLQRGSTMAQLLDPMGSNEASITSTFFTVSLLALFFMTGGFALMLDGFYRSYQLWQPLAVTPAIDAGAALGLLRLLDRVMHVGVLMVAPLVIALLVADLVLAYLSRVAPQLQVFDLSLPIKNLLFAFLILLYVALLVPFMLAELGNLRGVFDELEAFYDTGP